ncbi:prolipoprotein diacylglyceryl transferase [Hirsutella rhossiliensis]|uniref:Prolipoprotein diacylglyceryl transferase n=1 Tax=Hirsutella rhossiliensis TaxID=111463 RepID=A0A9P8MVX8_9HYPO|nr:prolipoprotein diacylglyceryl transferase [Hirsutella rhossiliensis]KAH0960147.1 prolipoprotein diacylglyceryl transferase [Hirsutella rhossiliensis]
MSLNGLDDPNIVEAHETAASEPGGWFLLKYSERDAVELLSRGNGGVVEMRNAVLDYDETSPLYGFLKYRRRNVIVKHLPEDCSRLIQARVAVHFNAICERFSPYDTMFEIAAASELKDTKLSSACSLHAASCSTSSSTSSLRRRRLMEIAEEEEEEQRASKRQSVHDLNGDRPRSPAAGSMIADPVALDSQLAASPEHAKFSADSTAELPTFIGLDHRPTSSAKSSDTGSIQPRPELFSSYSAPYGKPKVKLGPRPSLDVSGRPHTAGSFRPISAIPAGFKLFGKGIKKAKGSKNLGALAAASAEEGTAGHNLDPTATSIPEESLRHQGDTAAPATSSDASVDYATTSPPPSKKATVSPEKARLMKAMQLREKRKMMSLQPPIATPSSVDEDAPESKEVPADASEDNTQKMPAGSQGVDDPEIVSIHSDSGDVPDTASFLTHADQKSDLTQSDSRPASPVVTSSEADQSTKASSLSESTDETVRAKDDGSALGNEDVTHETTPEEDLKDNELPPDESVPLSDDSGLEVAAARASGGTKPHGVSKNVASAALSLGDGKQQDALVAHSDVEAPRSTASDTNAAVNVVHSDSEAVFDSETKTQDDEPQSAESTTSTDANQASTSNHDLVATADVVLPPRAVSAAPQQVAETMTIAALDNQTAAAESHKGDADEMETTSAQSGQPKRKGLIEPIQTDLVQHTRHTSRSEMNFSDDEELMEELQSATVQEAKPMLVAKTPVSATFSTGPAKGRTASSAPHAHTVRTVSNPVRGNLVVPTDVSQSSARSLSSGAAYLHQVTQQQQQQGGNLANKPNIGSSISQRIKALEKLSAASGDTGAPGSRERPSSTFFAVKKREPSKSPSVLERANSLRRNTPESRPQSKESSSESGRISRRERSVSVTDRLSLFESAPAAGVSVVNRSTSISRRGRPESVSVTAKIIRDSSQNVQAGFEPPKDPSEYSRLDLKQSPLLVDHRKAVPEPTRTAAVEPPPERRSTSEERNKSGKSRQSSLSIVKDFIKERRRSVTSNQGDVLVAPSAALPSRSPSRSPPVIQNSTFSPRLSISSRRSSLSQDRQSVTSPIGEGYGDDTKSANGDKKLSRAGRFMRRLSTLSGSRSRNSPHGIAHTVAEESLEPVVPRPATTGSPTIVSYMGDVNVQFPDTLLWKRRNLSLDSQGFLILSALPAHSGRPAQGIKRYHLSEFRPPYIPDVEVQELPDSVVLDFIEGTSIQFACEDRAGQANVLSILQEAHATRGSTYGL